MEEAEVVGGDILSIVVRDAVEGEGRGVPYWPEEVGNFPKMEEDCNDYGWKEDE